MVSEGLIRTRDLCTRRRNPLAEDFGVLSHIVNYVWTGNVTRVFTKKIDGGLLADPKGTENVISRPFVKLMGHHVHTDVRRIEQNTRRRPALRSMRERVDNEFSVPDGKTPWHGESVHGIYQSLVQHGRDGDWLHHGSRFIRR